VEDLLVQLTRDEKLALLAGRDTWTTPGVPRLGIPGLKLSDGPVGVRGARSDGSTRSASFPCGAALGASWSPVLVREVGAALGEEAHSKAAHVVLGPTVNLQRSPTGGRHFECYAEDPELTARLASAFVEGVQSRGVGACIKHFVCNDAETERHTQSSEVDDRALREVYLLPFERAVAEARPWSLMSAYNKLRGTWCSEHRWLLRELLKQEWGFDGFVVSDWFGTQHGPEAVRAGLDLEMPGPARHLGDPVRRAVESGELPEALVDQAARRLLRATARAGLLDANGAPSRERSEDRPEHRELARRCARESLVLLRNEGGLLPLAQERLRRLAVIGPNAADLVVQGGGSAQVNPHYTVSPWDALRQRCGDDVGMVFEPGCTRHRRLPRLEPPLLAPLDESDSDARVRIEFFEGPTPDGEPVAVHTARRAECTWIGSPAEGVDARVFSALLHASLRVPESGPWSLGVSSAGLARVRLDGELVLDNWTAWQRGDSFYGAGSDEITATVELEKGRLHGLDVEYSKERSPVIGGVRLGAFPPLPEDALERAATAAREADVALVVVGLDGDWETEGRDRTDLALPGRQDELVGRVAAENPRTVVVLNSGAPVDVEDWVERVPALLQLWYPGQEGGRALVDVLLGDAAPGGRLPHSWPRRLEDTPGFLDVPDEFGRVRYGEGVFVGHRAYDARGIEPRFPFGHGLSTTRFEIGPVEPDREELPPDEVLRVAVGVRNAGPRAGSEVVQLYVEPPPGPALRPPRELKAFARVELAPGESRTVVLELPPRAFAHWDPSQGRFATAAGEATLRVGRSSRDLIAAARVRLRGDAA